MTEHSHRGANEWADTYGSIGATPTSQQTQLPLSILDPWESPAGNRQPFRPYSKEDLDELAENIGQNGVISPITVRPRPNGRFQIIAGHNRVAASKLAGLTVIPAIIMTLDDDQATILMVDSNLQHRKKIHHSDKAFAYQERMEAITRMTARSKGRPTEKGAPMEHLFVGTKTVDVVAETVGESRAQIQRYIRLTKLFTPLLKLVDEEKLAFRAGVELSYLEDETQSTLFQVLQDHKCKPPSMAQAAQLREQAEDGILSEEQIIAILIKPKNLKASTIKLPAYRIGSFFPPNTSPDIMEAEIYEALLMYRQQNHSPASV